MSGSATDYSSDAYGDLASAGGVSYGYDALRRLVTRAPGSGTAYEASEQMSRIAWEYAERQSAASSASSSGGGGYTGGYGGGGCADNCGWYSPANPCAGGCYTPPPPPPPQDCYAGPDPACTPSPAPGSPLDGQLITHVVSNPTSLSVLRQQGRFIVEQAKATKTAVKGLTETSGTNGDDDGNGPSEGSDLAGLIGAIDGIGLPAAPAPGQPGGDKTTRQLAKKVAGAVAPVIQSVLAPVVNGIVSTAADALSCITHPQLRACLNAVASILPYVIGGGEASALGEADEGTAAAISGGTVSGGTVSEGTAAGASADTASPYAGTAVVVNPDGKVASVNLGYGSDIGPGSTTPAPEGSDLLDTTPSTLSGVITDKEGGLADSFTTYSGSIHYDTQGHFPAVTDYVSGAIMTGAMLISAAIDKLRGKW
ncbi:MAG: hypothetical protein ACRDN0_21220 [Trebonia sp.]